MKKVFFIILKICLRLQESNSEQNNYILNIIQTFMTKLMQIFKTEIVYNISYIWHCRFTFYSTSAVIMLILSRHGNNFPFNFAHYE